MAKTIEARLVISGEDKGASASIASVVKSVRQLEEVSKVSAPMQRLAKEFQQVEQASRAVSAAMSARTGFSAAEAGLRATQGAAQAAARALEQAKVARTAFDGVKAARGSAEAKEIEAATRAVRDYTAAQRKAEGDVRRATAAVAAQSSALQHAESAAVKLGADLSGLEFHQVRLRSATESATGALRTQLRVEDQAARSAAHLAKEQVEAARHMRQHGAIGLAAGAAAGAVSAHSVVHGTVDAVKAGARLQHETVSLKNAGRTDAELAQIERASRDTVKAVPTATFEENLKVVNETVSAFGSLDHALEHLTFMQKASAAVHAAAGAKITDSAGEMGNKMARFAEERGSAGDGHRFERETEGLVRAMVFSGGNFNPHEAINFAQQAKSSLRGYDEEFLTTIMPSIVGTMKGERAGTAANAFNNVINGKVNDKKQAEEWMKYGLLDKSQVIMKAGHATAWRSGAVKDTTLAHQNPLKWMETVVLPALKAKGVNVEDDEELSKVFATMFRQNTSNFLANEIGLKSFRDRLHKDAKLQKQTGSLDDIYNRNLKEDPTEGFKAVKSGLEDVLAAATSPLMASAAAGLKALAEGLQSIALAAKDHPMMAAGAGSAAVAGGLAASGFASYKIATGFGLPSAAAELTVAAKMLQGAAVEKGATPAAAAAAFGLGGITVAGGAIAGGYLDTNFGGNTGALGLVTGQEGDAAKSARFKAEQDAERARGALFGQRANVLDSLQREREVRDNLAKPDAPGLLTQGLDALGYGSSDERQKRRDALKAESEKNIAGMEAQLSAIDAKIRAAAATPLPPVRPPDLSQVETKAVETGQRAGQSIADGVKEKAPEVQEQGLTIFQKLKETFSQGIFVPINFTAGDGAGGGSGVQSASFGASGGLGGLVHRANFGSGSEGGSLGAGGIGGLIRQGGPGAPNANFTAGNAEVLKSAAAQLGTTPQDLATVIGYETRGTFSPSIIGGAGNRYQGLIQFGPTERRQYGADGGQSFSEQMPAVVRYLKHRGFKPGMGLLDLYSTINAGRPGLYDRRDQNGSVREHVARMRAGQGARAQMFLEGTKAPKAPESEPRLVKGADGAEGLDLGNGTMQMPDKSIRPIGRAGLEIPEPPAGVFGAGRQSMGAAAERMHAAVDRMEGMGFHGQIQLDVSGSERNRIRATGLKVRGRGGMSADMGVSMPGTKESDDDWR